MANVQQGFGNSPADAYFSIPPVTRYFATACLALTTLVNFKLISPYLIYLSWSHILKLQVGTRHATSAGRRRSTAETYVCRIACKILYLEALYISDSDKLLQVWRLISPFFFLGGFSFRFLIQLIWL